jgi:hypothetical protein
MSGCSDPGYAGDPDLPKSDRQLCVRPEVVESMLVGDPHTRVGPGIETLKLTSHAVPQGSLTRPLS